MSESTWCARLFSHFSPLFTHSSHFVNDPFRRRCLDRRANGAILAASHP